MNLGALKLLASTHRRGNPEHPATCWDIFDNCSTGADQRPRADGHTLIDCSPEADERTFPDGHAASEMNTWSELNVISENTIMICACRRVYDRVPSDPNIGLHDPPGKDNSSIAYDRTSVHPCHGVYHIGPPYRKALIELPSDAIRANPDNCRTIACNDWPRNFRPKHPPPPNARIVVQEAHDRASGRDPRGCNHLGMST